MKKNKRTRAGKDFELLVARIEERLAPTGAIVKSPDYIRDLVTGRMREVDASIRIPDGDSLKLITVECRDHTQGRQDDRWIEQLITKREKLGAWKTIAVSSSGFSDSAITTARSYGIELRQIDQISDAEIVKEWIGDFAITCLLLEFSVLDLTIIDIDGNFVDGDTLLPSLSSALGENLLETPFLHIKDKDLVLSTSDIVQISPPPEGLVEGGPPICVRVSLKPKDDTHYVETASGELVISQVLVGVEYQIRPFPIPIQSVKQYSSPDKPLMEMLEGTAPLDEKIGLKLKADVSLNKRIPIIKKPRKRKIKPPDGI